MTAFSWCGAVFHRVLKQPALAGNSPVVKTDDSDHALRPMGPGWKRQRLERLSCVALLALCSSCKSCEAESAGLRYSPTLEIDRSEVRMAFNEQVTLRLTGSTEFDAEWVIEVENLPAGVRMQNADPGTIRENKILEFLESPERGFAVDLLIECDEIGPGTTAVFSIKDTSNRGLIVGMSDSDYQAHLRRSSKEVFIECSQDGDTSASSTGDPTTDEPPTSTTGGSATGSTGETEGETDGGGDPLQDEEILRTGDPLEEGEVGRILSWGIADEDFVKARVGWVEDGAAVGESLVRWRDSDATTDVLASPDDLIAETGSPVLNYSLFDSDGFVAIATQAGCVGIYDEGFQSPLCPDNAALSPGALLFLRGLANGVALTYVVRNGGATPRFELRGVDAVNPLRTYLLPGDTVSGSALEDVLYIESHAIARDAGVLMYVAGRTETADSAAGLVWSDGYESGIVEADLSTGSMGPGGFYPGTGLGPEVPLANGRMFLGATVNEMGVYAFAFLPTDQDGNLDPSAGIYSIAPGEKDFTRHHDFNAEIFDGEGLTTIAVGSGGLAYPSISFGLTEDRRIVMVAELANGKSGVFRERDPEVMIDIATVGAVVADQDGVIIDGATFADFGSIVMADDGSLMFTARIEGPGIESILGVGVWGHGPDEDLLVSRELARFGQPLPGSDGVTIESIRIADQLTVPDQAGTDGLFKYRTVFNVSSNDLQVYGSSGSSQVIRPGTCPRGLVHLHGGQEDVLMLKTLRSSCE